MAVNRPKLIFLTGAPDAAALSWREEDLIKPESVYAGRQRPGQALPAWPTWRGIPSERQEVPSGLMQLARGGDEGEEPSGYGSGDPSQASFFTTAKLSFSSTGADRDGSNAISQASIRPDENSLSQFYDHSLAVHDNALSSEESSDWNLHGSLAATTAQTSLVESQGGSSLSCGSLSTSNSSNGDETNQAPPQPLPLGHNETMLRQVPAVNQLSNVQDIPSAHYLDSIAPQTMTVNLIVGIISIGPPRLIRTRMAGREMEIVEMLVGDETRAGFGISIWLSPLQKDALRIVMGSLRLRDVVLMRNIALSCFRAKVHGQSLHRGMTKLLLLHREPLDSGDHLWRTQCLDLTKPGADDPRVSKVKRVADWVRDFLAPAAQRHGGHRDVGVDPGVNHEDLPPDTP
ncbi:MAG: hypothetical protein M1838_002409 [Thelocarpon superellum]|nr:MAG: hypothetical protein M1838_002409 [Thelocarpon superellum]